MLFKKAFPKTLPVLAGFLFLGIAYGISMRENGFGVLWTGAISTFVFGGSMQFAMMGALHQAFAPVTIALLTLLIQARHFFYGLSMLDEYAKTKRFRPYLIFSLCDETYSIICNGAPKGVDAEKWYALVSVLNHVYWVMGSVLGAVLGQLIPLDWLTGIDFAMTALFTVIVTEQTMDAVERLKAGLLTPMEAIFSPAVGAICTLGSLLLVGKDSFLLVAMVLMLVAFLARWLMQEKERMTA